MSWLTSWLHPERGYDAGQGQLNNYYNTSQGRLQPYNDVGKTNIPNLQSYIDTLMHPEKLSDEWNKNYKESEAAKQAEKFATEHGVNAASSLGLGGSNTALNAIQSGTAQIGEQDRQKYLDDLWEKYKTGAGLTQGAINTGAGAATNQANNDMNMGTNSAGLQFGKTNAPGQMFGQGAGMIGKLIADYLTGGFGKGGFGRGAWSTGGS
jgi:hypothetical protein